MADVGDYHPACASVLEGLFEGLAAGCGRHIPVHLKPSAGGKAAVRLVDRVKVPVSPAIPQAPIAPCARGIGARAMRREALRARPSRRRARE